MQTALPWKTWLLAFMLLLNACSSPGQEVGMPPVAQDSTFGPLTLRRDMSEAPRRGRILDRYD